MANVNLMPLAGMNTVDEDSALQRGGDSPRLYVRDAVNVDISSAGKASLRAGVDRVTEQPYRNLWQSPLHKDTFAAIGDQWVKVDPVSWIHTNLATIGNGTVFHEVVNNQVIVAGDAGLFTFNGSQIQSLTIETPPPPLVITGNGSLDQGRYGVAVSWVRGSLESAPSMIANAEVPAAGSLQVTLPFCFDTSVTAVRLYLTKPNGGELMFSGWYEVGSSTIDIPLLPSLGRTPQFQYKSPMPTGKYLKYWRGRLLTAKANVLRFSEPLAYHLSDERHGFVQMPQRITFVLPVDGGIWVGQVDHVAFLQGSQPDELVMLRKTAKAPVPDSGLLIDADVVGGDMSQGGGSTALWLASNGYVVGTSSGQVVELQSGVMSGITAKSGTSVVLDRKVVTTVV